MIRVNFKVDDDCVKENFNRHFNKILITFYHCRDIVTFVLIIIMQFTLILKSFLLLIIFNDFY